VVVVVVEGVVNGVVAVSASPQATGSAIINSATTSNAINSLLIFITRQYRFVSTP
jgi:hypothetical protein